MKTFQKQVSLLLALLTLVLVCSTAVPIAKAAGLTIDAKHTVSFIARSKILVYCDSKLTTRGSADPYRKYNSYIDRDDEVFIIYQINANWLYVLYPAGSTKKRGYIRRSDVLPADSPTATVCAKTSATTYRYPGGASYGRIDKNDTVYKFGETNGYSALIYPISGGKYKLGFLTNNSYKSIVNTSYDPFGYFDGAVSNSVLKVRVTGWSIDYDARTQALDTHVYVNGAAGSGAWGIALGKANASRPDVGAVYKGCGNNHGIDFTFTVPEKYGGTTVTLYLYAISVGGGNNTLLGTKKVTVKGKNTSSAGKTFDYPMTNAQVKTTSNDWREYYAARPERPYHVGVDLTSASGDNNIYACATGTVAARGYNSANGNYVVLKHTINGSTVYSFYCHLKSYCVSKIGDPVSKGTKIGVMGDTGSGAKGAHLHFAFCSTLKEGSYYGYAPYFTGDKTTYGGCTYYNPHYVIKHQRLP